ncbi:hypothetical protein K440DRAFT_660025 [Wilcoxina mikolae CBS 423.85]|nr:hypothetical protein K440DRAFT_660025 [Wilcoxina mikolae CBS 423.85]
MPPKRAGSPANRITKRRWYQVPLQTGVSKRCTLAEFSDLCCGSKSRHSLNRSLPTRVYMMTVVHGKPEAGELATPAKPIDGADVPLGLELRTIYSALFRIWYNKSVGHLFDNSFTKINSLIYVARIYGCILTISSTVELMVISWSRSQHGNGIVSSLCRCPRVLLANAIRSETLYNDAFVHLVGLLGLPRYWEAKNKLPQGIRDRVVEEYVNLYHKRMAVERSISRCLSWYLNTNTSQKKDIQMLDDILTLFYKDDNKEKNPKNKAAIYRSIISIKGASETVDWLLVGISSLSQACGGLYKKPGDWARAPRDSPESHSRPAHLLAAVYIVHHSDKSLRTMAVSNDARISTLEAHLREAQAGDSGHG